MIAALRAVAGADTITPLPSAVVAAAGTNPVVALPGHGLAQHAFLYTGEWDHRKQDQTIYLIREGRVEWSYSIPIKDTNGVLQELGDATRLSNGNILFCRKVGASEITPDKKIVWDITAPKGTEIHSVQPIGLDRVLLMENGNPPRLLLINKETGRTEKALTLPAGHPDRSHLQFRRVRETGDGTFLAAHLDANQVVEYDTNGVAIWKFPVRSPWSAVRLKNGNTLITSYHNTVLEVNRQGQVVWDFSATNAPAFQCFIFQGASRLANGNTVICNWCPADLKDPKQWPGTVQLLEATPEKKVVWALSQWDNPDLGPASSIQLLDEPGVPEKPGDSQQ